MAFEHLTLDGLRLGMDDSQPSPSGLRVLTLDDLLEQLQVEGQKDSSGRFTLDARSAAPKLRAFRLANPYFYVLKLVQSAVASGAGRIQVTCSRRGVHLVHDGKLDAEHAEWLFHHGFSDEAPEAVRLLAEGVGSAVGATAQSLELACWDGQRGIRQVWRAGIASKSAWRPGGAPRLQFSLRRWLRDQFAGWVRALSQDVFDLLTSNRRSMTGEGGAVYDRCPYLNPKLYLNGRLVNHFVFGSPRVSSGRHHLAERLVPARQPKSSSSFLPPRPHLQEPLEAMLAIEQQLRPVAHLTWLQSGVTLMEEQLELGVPGLVALLSCEGLNTDISGFRLVHDAAYRERIAWLRHEAANLSESRPNG